MTRMGQKRTIEISLLVMGTLLLTSCESLDFLPFSLAGNANGNSAETTETEAEEPAEMVPDVADLVAQDVVDFSHMRFFVNNQEVVLGETVLQDLVDDDVPFVSEDQSNLKMTVPVNQQVPFRIQVSEDLTAQISVLNTTKEQQSADTLIINELYLPVHQGEQQTLITLTFPTDLTSEQLITVVGEPDETTLDEEKGTEILCYWQESEHYVNPSTYRFEFIDGALSYVTITYLP